MSLNQVLFLLAGAVIGLLLYRQLSPGRRLKSCGVRQVGAGETLELIKRQKAVVVDVREDREYRAGRIPNARHIPLGQVRFRLKELERYRDKPIVVSCRSGRRSASACLFLCKNGFSNVYNLKGGLIAWQRANMKMES